MLKVRAFGCAPLRLIFETSLGQKWNYYRPTAPNWPSLKQSPSTTQCYSIPKIGRIKYYGVGRYKGPEIFKPLTPVLTAELLSFFIPWLIRLFLFFYSPL
jgi:hypothetical protein